MNQFLSLLLQSLDMKKVFSLVIVFIAFTHISFGQSYLEEFRIKWDNATSYTLSVLDSFPESKMDEKPSNESRSGREQFEHLLKNMLWLSSKYLKEKEVDYSTFKLTNLSKIEIRERLQKGFEFVQQKAAELSEKELNEKVDFFAGEVSKRQIITLINDHLTHHRAQLIVYLRIFDAKPPKYIGW